MRTAAGEVSVSQPVPVDIVDAGGVTLEVNLDDTNDTVGTVTKPQAEQYAVNTGDSGLGT